MTDIAALEVELDLDNNQFTTKLTRSGEALQSFEKKVDGSSKNLKVMERQIDSTGQAVNRLQNMLKGYVGFRALTAGFTELVNTQKAMQQIQYGLQGALGSASAAGAAYKYIAEESEVLGLNLQVTATEFTKVTAAATAMNVPMSQQKQLFDALARSQTVLHLSTDQVKYSTMALAQMFGKGKIQAEELRRQLGEQIPGVVPRFQRAVMEMTKGTDLAGKSFDQLLQGGLLTTDKFLPALIKALQETGQGAEEASKGLNANLNRLSSNWFKLKAEMSGGLFNDALTESVKLLAESLRGLVTVAGVASGLMGARYASKGVSAVGSKVERSAQERVGSLMAAEAEVAHTKAIADSTRAKILKTEATIKDNGATIKAARLQQAEALTLKQIANEALLAAKAELALATAKTGKNTPKAFIRRANEARAVEAAAQETLTQAELKYQVVARKSQNVAAAQTVVRGRLVELKLAETGATEALVVAETQLARAGSAASAMGRIGAAIKGIGGSLLSLAGGPVGIVIAAIGAIGFAFMEARSEAKHLEEDGKANAKALEQTVAKSDLLRASFKELGNASPLSQLTNDAAEMTAQLQAAGEQLKKQQEELNAIRAHKEGKVGDGALGVASTLTGVSGAVQAYTLLVDTLSGKEKALAKDNDRLADTLDTLAGKIAADRQAELKAYGTAWEGLGDKISSLDVGIPGVINSISELKTAINDFGNAKTVIDDGRAAWDAYTQKVTSQLTAAQKKLRQFNMTASEAAADDLKMALASAKAGNVDGAEQSQGGKDAAELTKTTAALEAAKAARKDAAAASRDATAAAKEHESQLTSLTDRIARQNEMDKEALGIGGKLLPAERLIAAATAEFASAKNRLTKAEQAGLLVSLDTLRLSEQKAEAQKKELEATQRLTELKEKLDNQLASAVSSDQDSLAGLTGGSAEQERLKRMTSLQREYYANLVRFHKDAADKNLADTDASYKAQQALIKKNYAQRVQEEVDYQAQKRVLENDGVAGMRAAVDDFADAANNMNQNIKRVTNDALNGITDQITDMVTTGKADFKGLFTSLLKEITRVLVAKEVAALANFVKGLFGVPSGGGGGVGGNSYIGGNGTGGFGMMTQSANGNVMTSAGPAQLNMYANGGIAKSPQLSLFGEGRMPEAYVPLPDGRSIPVTMEGGGGGGGVQNNVSINVNVDNKGASEATSTEKNGDTKAARQFGELINVKVKETMAQEMRQGGLLWKMRTGG